MISIFKIHPLTYLLIFISLLSGKFKIIISFLLLIVFHELGHFLMAKVFNWKIDKIYIYPLGGITRFNDKINKPFIEELLVAIMGPIFQIVLTILLCRIDNIINISKTLLIFNLLPIVPLDGGRIFNISLSLIKPYKKSMIYTIKISYVVYLFLFVISINFNSYFFVLIIFLLVFKINDERKSINYLFNRFIIERYLESNKYKRSIIINKLKDIYKYKNNIIKKDNRLYQEKEYISLFLNKKEL